MSTTEPCSKAWIWGRMLKDAGMFSYPVLVTSPTVCGDKTTPTRNDCIAWLGSIVGSWVQVPARVDLRCTDYIQWGQAWLLKGYKAGLPHNCCGSCRPELTGSQRSEHTAMTIYAYLIWSGAGFRKQLLHQKILYYWPRGKKKKKKKGLRVSCNISLCSCMGYSRPF
jgi:hypothetical protein